MARTDEFSFDVFFIVRARLQSDDNEAYEGDVAAVEVRWKFGGIVADQCGVGGEETLFCGLGAYGEAVVRGGMAIDYQM